MDYEGRQARQARVRKLRDAAIEMARVRGKGTYNIVVDDCLKRFIEYDDPRFRIMFVYPRENDDLIDPRANYLEVRHRGEPVLRLHWNGDRLKTSLYVPGRWERELFI